MPTLIAGALGTTTSAVAFNWTHRLQVPLLLLVSGLMAWHYAGRASAAAGEAAKAVERFGPLALHVLGTCLLLVQPVFDVGGLIWDIKHGPATRFVKPPVLTKGGFWHHGWFMAFCEVSGLLCLMAAAIWASALYEEPADSPQNELESFRPLAEKGASGRAQAYSSMADA